VKRRAWLPLCSLVILSRVRGVMVEDERHDRGRSRGSYPGKESQAGRGVTDGVVVDLDADDVCGYSRILSIVSRTAFEP